MSKSRRPPRSTDYEIGYGRPPKETRFQPGCSGNPKGRPRKPKTVGDILEEALARRIKIEENGRQKSVSAEEFIIRRVVHDAAKGDLKAFKMVFALKERYRDSSAESIDPHDLQADKDILDAYVARVNAGQPAPGPEAGNVEPDRENAQDSAIGDSSHQPGDES